MRSPAPVSTRAMKSSMTPSQKNLGYQNREIWRDHLPSRSTVRTAPALFTATHGAGALTRHAAGAARYESFPLDYHPSPYRRSHMGRPFYLLFCLGNETMKIYTVKIKHIATGIVYTMPVLAVSQSEANFKAGQWPYSNDAFLVELNP